MNRKDSRILRKRKRKLEERLQRRQYADQPRPMFKVRNVQYDMAERTRAIDCGGVGALHVLAQRAGLVDAINEKVHVLKQHKPYHESDHVLNVAYNGVTGGTCLGDIEQRRKDEAYMDALGAERIPDPTTAGDFCRRFGASDVADLMEAVNGIRPRMWKRGLPKAQRREAILDMDGVIAPTWGECKEGMDLSYKGVWGYHPLVISLAHTMEPLYLVNRPGNRPSHDGAVEWIDRAIGLVRESFESVCLRGDTDFALTAHFDRWTDAGVRFAFGIDAMPNLVRIAESLENRRWEPLNRPERSSGAGRQRRRRPRRVKQAIVEERGYRNIHLHAEHVAHFLYQPGKCDREYRVIALRKDLWINERQRPLFQGFRYFFYITNIEELSAAEVVLFCNERCNQENLIEQLKNGLNALRMPVGDLASNWAYMVMASLAWTLKAWFALMARRVDDRMTLLGMEFRRFLNAIVRVPCQIITAGRRILYRILGYNQWTPTFVTTFTRIRRLRFT